jgi:hypothetical protein
VRLVPSALLIAFLLGCSGPAPSVSTEAKPEPERGSATARAEPDPTRTEPAETAEPAAPAQEAKTEASTTGAGSSKPAKAPDAVKPPAASNNELAGTYRLALTKAQIDKIETELAQIRKAAEAGDKQAQQYLPLTEAAAAAAKDMNVQLKPDGTYVAMLGPNSSSGTYTMNGDAVALKPREEASANTGMPSAVVMAFDKRAQTLTVSLGGEPVVFKRQG